MNVGRQLFSNDFRPLLVSLLDDLDGFYNHSNRPLAESFFNLFNQIRFSWILFGIVRHIQIPP